MKKVFTILALLCIGVKGFSQQDSAKQKTDSAKHSNHYDRMMEKHMKMMDAMRMMDIFHHGHKYHNENGFSHQDSLILKEMDSAYTQNPEWAHMMEKHIKMMDAMDLMDHMPYGPHQWNKKVKPKNISTNWLIVDLGFTNYTDKTNYASASAQAFAPGGNSNWFNLRNNKSVDVNIWLFMQRLNVVKHVVNLKYGLGIELNNYRYESNITYGTNPTTQATFAYIPDSLHYTKNKLAADYVTVPLMINFNFTPDRKEGFGISVGISAGYLYSSRQKTISGELGKKKNFDDFDLNPWKLSWIAEAQLGPVILYGSLATKSMFNSQGLNQVPYTFGLRLSKW